MFPVGCDNHGIATLQNKRVFDRIASTVHFRQPTDTGWASAEIGIHPLFSTFPH
jgi:hypothetical protein